MGFCATRKDRTDKCRFGAELEGKFGKTEWLTRREELKWAADGSAARECFNENDHLHSAAFGRICLLHGRFSLQFR